MMRIMRWLGIACCLLLIGCAQSNQDERELKVALAEMKAALQMSPPRLDQISAKNLTLASRYDLAKGKLSQKQAASAEKALQAVQEFIHLHNKNVTRFENPELFFYPTEPYQKWVRTTRRYLDSAINDL